MLPNLLRALGRRGRSTTWPVDTTRCATLAMPDVAEQDLIAEGFPFRRGPKPHPAAVNVGDDLVRLIHHIQVRVFRRMDAASRRDRYSRGFAAYYAGAARETAYREMDHFLRSRYFVVSPTIDTFTCDVLEVEFFGSWWDLCGLETHFPGLTYDKDLRLPQRVGAALKGRKHTDGLRVPSARHRRRGSCQPNIVAFTATSLTPLSVAGTVTFKRRRNKYGRYLASSTVFTRT